MMKLTKDKLLEFEGFLARFVNVNEKSPNGPPAPTPITDGGLSWGFGRNVVLLKNTFKQIREELALTEPSQELRNFDEARTKWLSENPDLPEFEKVKYVENLKDEFKIREEVDGRVAKLTEILNEEMDVKVYRISRQKVSGMRDGDDPGKCVLNAKDSAYLQDLGILYDPDDEE